MRSIGYGAKPLVVAVAPTSDPLFQGRAIAFVVPAALRGNNGSAFFFRLPLRAKSAMAEILVSDLCELSPALVGGRFSLATMDQHATTSEEVNRPQPDVSTRRDFRLFLLFCALFFPLLAIVPAPAAFLSPSQGLVL